MTEIEWLNLWADMEIELLKLDRMIHYARMEMDAWTV